MLGAAMVLATSTPAIYDSPYETSTPCTVSTSSSVAGWCGNCTNPASACPSPVQTFSVNASAARTCFNLAAATFASLANAPAEMFKLDVSQFPQLASHWLHANLSCMANEQATRECFDDDASRLSSAC